MRKGREKSGGLSRKKKAVIGTACGLAAAAAGLSGATAVIMKKQFPRGEYPDRSETAYYRFEPDFSDTHRRENVQFKSGENTLQGYIYGLENSEPKGLLVFAHGIYAGHESYIDELMWFADRGWLIFAYDATGSCTSEGEGTVGLVQSALDLDKALDYVESDSRLSTHPVCLLGHSWGGYAVCAVQNFDHKLAAAAELSGYADPAEMLELGSERAVGKALTKVFRPFALGYNKLMFWENAGLNAVEGINKAAIPMLIIHGENDDYVDYSRVSILSKEKQITDPYARFMTLRGKYADHNDFFNSERSNLYQEPFRQRLEELKKEYGGNVPKEIREQLIAEEDPEIVNEVNEELLTAIEDHFLQALKG